MPLPVIVADDSAMSRKLTIKALPPEWDVEVTQAASGHEALEAVRHGRGHVMFLDLTMPEMDGFEVLQAIHDDELDCFVIVVSADVQPKARERVRRLGGMGFVPKPVNGREIARLLREFGLL